MTYFLNNDCAYCDCNGQLFVLDERRDRYFRLGGRSKAALSALAMGVADDEAAIVALKRSGLIVAERSKGRPIGTASIDVPLHSLMELSVAMPKRSGNRMLAAWALSTTWVGLRTRNLKRVFDSLRMKKGQLLGQGDMPIRDLMAVVAGFQTTRRYIPATSICLLDSVALMRFLLWYGFAATLVVGVRDDPFSSHCWVQHDGLLLNEAADHAATFTPILTI